MSCPLLISQYLYMNYNKNSYNKIDVYCLNALKIDHCPQV